MDAQKLESLGAVIDAADAAGGPTPEQTEQAAQEADAESKAREWGMIAYTVGGALAMLAPELRQVYTEQACMAWGHSVVPVSEKYGWGNPSNVPEVGMLIATMGLAVPSWLVIRHKLATLKAEREAAERSERAARSGGAMPSPVQAADVPTAGATHGTGAAPDGG